MFSSQESESKKARDGLNFQRRLEAGRMSAVDTEDGPGPSYYGLGSAARRESCELDGRTRERERESYINDDLADEVEAIRLAADFSSRKLLSEQKRDRRDSLAVTPASASRMRIRAILDKQKTLKVSWVTSISAESSYFIFLGGRGKIQTGKKRISRYF